jgi:perosamine synthetase
MIIPRYHPYLDFEEMKALYDSTEDIIQKFERSFAKLVGSKYAVTFSHGRSALYCILKSLDIEKKEILIPSYTCGIVPSVIIDSGNSIRFTDISLTDYNMIIDDALKKISKKTKAIVPVHTYGYPVDIKELKEGINEDVYIIEDAALALLSKNTGKYSNITFYSLDIVKQIYTSGGGIATTNNKEIYEKLKGYISRNSKNTKFNEINKLLKILSSYLIFNKIFFKAYDIIDKHYVKKLYSRYMDQFQFILLNDFLNVYSRTQAKIGLVQLKKIHDIVKKTTFIAKFYNDELSTLRNIELPPLIDGATYSKYTIRVKKRDEFQKTMEKKGIYVNNLWPYSVAYYPKYKKYLKTGKFKNSLTASQSVINLPNYPSLYDNSDTLDYIVDTIKKYNKKIV